jgi:hypothetical protein
MPETTNYVTGSVDSPDVPNLYEFSKGDTIIWIPLRGEEIQSIVATSGSFNSAPKPVPGARDGSWSAVVKSYDGEDNLNYKIVLKNVATGTLLTKTPLITINPVVD